MKLFLSTLPRNLLRCFNGWMAAWHVLAIVLTFVLVTSGLDWHFFLCTRSQLLRSWMFPSVVIGGLLPIILPLLLLAIGSIARNGRKRVIGWAIGQAELIGAIIAAFYKALTGRAHPAHLVGEDLTHLFRFGFLRGGVF